MTGLNDLALIGNCSVAALINGMGDIVWACLPRFDSDALFCSLLRPRADAAPDSYGYASIELMDFSHAEQYYAGNTAILVTRLYDKHQSSIEITDFAPRFQRYGRSFHPTMLIRQVQRLSGNPRVRVRMRPACDYGAQRPTMTYGSNHLRYITPDFVLRMTTDCSITAIIEELPFYLQDTFSLVLGADEILAESVPETVRLFRDETTRYWNEWVRSLSVAFEWQTEIIRAAITIKLNTYDDTGAIVAAITTSIPEAADSGRNWDYRYCWLRDAYFVVNALNQLNATQTMERYIAYIANLAGDAAGAVTPGGAQLQPVYRINGRAGIAESEKPSLPGYRGMGPVRVGNQAYSQIQNDVFGAAILASMHVFFDTRLKRVGDAMLFRHLEALGEQAILAHDRPDAGLWELRNTLQVHTFSSVMCWVACDRLAKIAVRLGMEARASYWLQHARTIHRNICERAWSSKRNSFVATFDGTALDASLLLLNRLGFLAIDDPRFISTVQAIEKEMLRGNFVFRYTGADDFGVPQNAFLVCSFWYIDVLASMGRKAEARELFEMLLACRNRHGLLAEHVDPHTRELWGNFPQTYSMVGLINAGMQLSIPWSQAF